MLRFVVPSLLSSFLLPKTFCSATPLVKKGDQGPPTTVTEGVRVAVHYTGKLEENGEQFDSSIGRDPLEFEVGAGQMILGFDAAVQGMKVNATPNPKPHVHSLMV